MDNSIAQLRDIYLPEQISWWPLAPGWYILGGIACLIIFGSIFYLKRYLAYSRGKRIALRDLMHYQQQYQSTKNSLLACAQISELLKRVVLFYYPRTQVAGLQGNKWLAFLNQTSKNIDFNSVRIALLELPYQAQLPEGSFQEECEELFNLTRSWIKQRGKPCSS